MQEQEKKQTSRLAAFTFDPLTEKPECVVATDTHWLSPTDFVSGDESLKISYPSVTHPAVEIKTTAPGDLKWIYLGLRVPPDNDIHAIHVCYQLSNSRSFISQVRLVEMQTPDQTVVRHDDGTNLLSTTPTCYRSPVVVFRPGAAVLLALCLNFGNVADTITLGAIGMEVPSHRIKSVVRPEDFGAVGDGVTDDGPAIQCALVASWAAKLPLHLYAKTYATAQEIDIPPNSKTNIIGTRALGGTPTIGATGSTFKAIAPMRAVLSMANGGAIENLAIDGNRKALVGIYGQTCSLGTFRAVGVGNCLRDGICFVGEDDSDHYTSGSLTLEMLRFLRCNNTWVKASRHLPQSGVTCSVIAGNPVITFQGTIDLATLGLSGAANVIIKSGNNIARCHLLSVDSAGQLTVDSAPAFTAVGCDFSLSNFKHSINDTNSFFECSGGGNGHIWNTVGADNDYKNFQRTVLSSGSGADVTDGSAVVNFPAGSIDLYAMMLREGDGVRIGPSLWRGGTPYPVGAQRTNNGNTYEVTIAGTSADTGGPTGEASDILDGDVHWKYLSVFMLPKHGMIVSIESPSQMTVTFKVAFNTHAATGAASLTLSGLDFAIASGDGYHECRSGDNNVNSFQGTSLWSGNANCHFAFAGFYGPLLVGQQMQYAGMYSIRVGLGGQYVITATFLKNYSEAPGSGKMFFLWSVLGCGIHAPNDLYGHPDTSIDYNGDHGGGAVTGVYYAASSNSAGTRALTKPISGPRISARAPPFMG